MGRHDDYFPDGRDTSRRGPRGCGPDDLGGFARAWQQHGRGWGGPGWGGPGWGGPGGPGGRRGGPPPWVMEMFGGGRPEGRGPGPKVRRGDVRSAILDVMAAASRAEEPINGYQVIQQIAERSDGAWRPSPGSVYPTIQQLQDEGLVEPDEERGRRTIRLSAAGVRYVEEHPDEMAAVWAPFEAQRRSAESDSSDRPDVKSEVGQVMSAVWQIVTQGSDDQRRAALATLVETRRTLYGILADGPTAGSPAPDAGDDEQDDR